MKIHDTNVLEGDVPCLMSRPMNLLEIHEALTHVQIYLKDQEC